ncbi:MAG TPA: adenylosuccinate synthetase [Methanofastidiosum sp.]|nr:adenylosuccinate synthetase [Methanofastidiosum sp.]
MIHIVVGLGLGDEGKGSVTSHLCGRASSPIVIRYCGGHQAGHTVQMSDGRRHVFQSFGSGTLRGIPTYWSKNCTFYPIGFVRELYDLQAMKIEPRIYVDPLAPVTTVYDVLYNQALEIARSSYKHGSVGVGVGPTFERHETINKIYFRDLYYTDILQHKLKQIKEYYINKVKMEKSLPILKKTIESHYKKNKFALAEKNFLDSVDIIRDYKRLSEKVSFDIFHRMGFRDFILEGAQGTLLDKDFGFFPYVTRANTSIKNALDLLEENKLSDFRDRTITTVNYVIRAYATRHGAGPLFTEGIIDHLKEGIVDQTNQNNEWQGVLRRGCLDKDTLIYALNTNRQYYETIKEHLYITCMDELKDKNSIKLKYTNNEFFNITAEGIANLLDMSRCFYSESPLGEFKEISI